MAPASIPPVVVVLGVDTHRDTHAACLLDSRGGRVAESIFAATPAGYAALEAWACQHGTIALAAVEGTASFGKGLTRHLQSAGLEVREVVRPKREVRTRGKSDPLDAEAAARAGLAELAGGRRLPEPKGTDGLVEALRIVRAQRSSAIRARTTAANQIHSLVVAAPEPLRSQLRGQTILALARTCARWRPGPARDAYSATRFALWRLSRRWLALHDEIRSADADLETLTATVAPGLCEQPGIGPETAATLLVTAGPNPDRLKTEASFARLCGAAPIPVSTGRTDRHRLDRGGDRQANRALFVIALTRSRTHQPTRDYIARRIAEGRTRREAIRCVKRYIARDVYRILTSSP